MPKRVGYLGLGSNVGDRVSQLRAAIELLREGGVEVEAVSSTYETEPVGEVLDQPDFLNAAVRIRTALEAERCWTSASGSRRSGVAPSTPPATVRARLTSISSCSAISSSRPTA